MTRALSAADAVTAAWTVGALEYKLHAGQLDLYERQMAMRPLEVLVEVIARQWGKTTETIVLTEIFNRRNPESIVRYAVATEKQAKTIVIPIWQKVMADCPLSLRAKWRSSEGCYIWPNGSRLYLAGTDEDPDRLRGPRTDLAILDEAGFHRNLQYVVEDVLGPTLDSCGGRMILPTTPPPSMDHHFVTLWEEAMREGRAIRKTLFDNPLYSADYIRAICRKKNPRQARETDDGHEARLTAILAGVVKGSPAWRREYMCEMVTDETRRVVPEFETPIHVKEIERPEFFTPYVFIDPAFVHDFTAVLFCWYSFRDAMLYVEDEYLVRKTNTDELVTALRRREKELWNRGPDDVRRWGDNSDQRLFFDMQSLHGYTVGVTRKPGTREASVNDLRVRVRNGQVAIHPRCVSTIRQLEQGIWKSAPGSRPDFERSEALGHLDCIAALMYGVRNVQWNENNIPAKKPAGNDLFLSRVDALQNQRTSTIRKLFRSAFR